MKPTTTESSPVRPIIQAIDLSKTFRTLKRKPGFVGAIRNLFRLTRTLTQRDTGLILESKLVRLSRPEVRFQT